MKKTMKLTATSNEMVKPFCGKTGELAFKDGKFCFTFHNGETLQTITSSLITYCSPLDEIETRGLAVNTANSLYGFAKA